jgi:dATP pyrophosphohydrolase
MEDLHRKVQVVILAMRGSKLHLLKLKTNKKRGSFWQNVTGKVEKNEGYEEGALREAIEETKIPLEAIIVFEPINYSFKFIDSRDRHANEEVFLIIAEEIWDIHLDPHEHDECEWKEIDLVNENDFKYDTNFIAFQKAKELIQRRGFI